MTADSVSIYGVALGNETLSVSFETLSEVAHSGIALSEVAHIGVALGKVVLDDVYLLALPITLGLCRLHVSLYDSCDNKWGEL